MAVGALLLSVGAVEIIHGHYRAGCKTRDSGRAFHAPTADRPPNSNPAPAFAIQF
jgi:hypothetical protein